MHSRIFYLISAAVILAAGIRLLSLDTNPPGFFRDEADKGYTSYLLLKTGCDGSGKRFPLFVQSLRVTTSSLYQYVDIPFVAVLGLEERAVRLPAALAGCLAVFVTFVLARRVVGKRDRLIRRRISRGQPVAFSIIAVGQSVDLFDIMDSSSRFVF